MEIRRARWLVLVVLIAIVSAVGFVYHAKKTAQARNAPKPPAKLPEEISARANDWTWESTRQGRPSVRIWATDMKTNADSTHVELTGVRLHLFHKDGKTYDSVASAKADFDIPNSQMFSDGEVQITMGVPADQPEAPPPGGRLVVVKTSGVHFDSKSGKAFTDRAASFQFDRGEGQSVGATSFRSKAPGAAPGSAVSGSGQPASRPSWRSLRSVAGTSRSRMTWRAPTPSRTTWPRPSPSGSSRAARSRYSRALRVPLARAASR